MKAKAKSTTLLPSFAVIGARFSPPSDKMKMAFVAIGAVITLGISLAALSVSIVSYQETREATRNGMVRENLARYLAAYADTMKEDEHLTNVDAFLKLSWREQRRVEIVDGLLATVVDAMYTTDDERAEVWANYLRYITAPVAAGFHLEAYVSHPKTRRLVEEIEESSRQSRRKLSAGS
ncbi:MAG: hypothetical protein M3Y03_03685 [Verrucomicrobiota bacterium]|nr:hypothetical protein [Verrucomicrobiota bacterium]